MQPRRRDALLALLALPGAAWSADAPGSTGEYQPSVGQPGKDVVWVPTPDAVVERMLDMAEVTAKDHVVDLGSGDGKIAIAAARRGARARGIEYNPEMVKLSRRIAREQGVRNVEFVQGDIFKTDFTGADVVTLYLLPTLNERLRPILLRMKPGTRVTSHQFSMGDWEPDRTDQLEGRSAHLWIVPARVAGRWNMQTDDDESTVQLRLTQKYQHVAGQAVRDGQALPLAEARLRGTQLRFDLPDGAGGVQRVAATATSARRMRGTIVEANGQQRSFTAVRA